MVADAIFPQVNTYNDIKVNFKIYITKDKLNNLKVEKNVPQVLIVLFVPNSFSQSSSSFLPSIGHVLQSSVQLLQARFIVTIKRLASSTSLECTSYEHEVEELLALFRNLDLRPQPRPFQQPDHLPKIVSHISSPQSG